MTNDEIITAARRLRNDKYRIFRQYPDRTGEEFDAAELVDEGAFGNRRKSTMRRKRAILASRRRRIEKLKTFNKEQRPIARELMIGSATKREITERFGLTIDEVRAIAARLADGESAGNCAKLRNTRRRVALVYAT